MGFFGFFETLFGYLESFFKKLFDDGPAWVKTVQTVITYISPLLDTVVGLVSGSATEAAAQALITEVQNALQTVLNLLNDAGANEATIESTLTAVVNNLQALLQEVGIKDAGLEKQITVAVTTIVQEIEAILKSLPAGTAAIRKAVLPEKE